MRTLRIETARVFEPFDTPSRYKAAYGGRGCVHPDTLIDTPSGQVRIKDFKGGEVLSHENGKVVVAKATKPVEFSEEQLYEVVLDNKTSIIVTDEHKFLTARGWVELQHLSKSDEVCVSQSSRCSSDIGMDFHYIKIRLIRNHSRIRYWDLHVYGTNNYLSNGIVNHNSGKSHCFAEKLIEDSLMFPGLLSVCIREVQKSLKDSAYRLIASKLEKFGLGEADGFKVYNDKIQTPGDGVIIFQGMQDHTAESIKSLEGFKRAWVEEAQTFSAKSLKLLRPTIRVDDSEIWFSWNPRRKTDPVDELFRSGEPPTDSIVVRANWSDNPWFTHVLEQERQDCWQHEPDEYPHIWEGDYETVTKGAYYAHHIQKAKQEGRITKTAADPLLPKKAFMDLGGTGSKSDAFSIWICQFVGKEIIVLDYYESQGQPLQAHLEWMRQNDHTAQNTQVKLPHDGATNDRVYSVSFESAFKDAGYNVEVVPNQGKGAAKQRIEAARRQFPRISIDPVKCQAGLEAIGSYHEKIDEQRGIGLGPEHDWSSHAADAFGLMCVCYKEPKKFQPLKKPNVVIA